MFEHWFGTCCIIATFGFWSTLTFTVGLIAWRDRF